MRNIMNTSIYTVVGIDTDIRTINKHTTHLFISYLRVMTQDEIDVLQQMPIRVFVHNVRTVTGLVINMKLDTLFVYERSCYTIIHEPKNVYELKKSRRRFSKRRRIM